jgi:hypothetical protein
VVSCTPGPSAPPGARTLNFSAGGVLFLSPTPLEAGQDVDIVLRLPNDREDLPFAARVVRVRSVSDRSHEVAAEFLGGDAGSQRALLDYIEARAGFTPDPGPRISA